MRMTLFGMIHHLKNSESVGRSLNKRRGSNVPEPIVMPRMPACKAMKHVGIMKSKWLLYGEEK